MGDFTVFIGLVLRLILLWSWHHQQQFRVIGWIVPSFSPATERKAAAWPVRRAMLLAKCERIHTLPELDDCNFHKHICSALTERWYLSSNHRHECPVLEIILTSIKHCPT
jgi:hypothetical protein